MSLFSCYDFILFIEVKQRLVSIPVKDDKLRFEFLIVIKINKEETRKKGIAENLK